MSFSLSSFFTNSKWNHVAMAVGFQGRMCLLEALGASGVTLNTYLLSLSPSFSFLFLDPLSCLSFSASLRFEDELKRGSTIGVRRLIMDDRMMLRKHQMGLLAFVSFSCRC